MSEVSNEFTCKCGKQKGWITVGKEHPNPCPECGRRYRGEYDSKACAIQAVEMKENMNEADHE